MSKGLDALDYIKFYTQEVDWAGCLIYDEQFNIIEKELKALEILKDKLELYFKVEKDKDGNNYYYLFQKVCENYLTSKEYELLKDVLGND